MPASELSAADYKTLFRLIAVDEVLIQHHRQTVLSYFLNLPTESVGTTAYREFANLQFVRSLRMGAVDFPASAEAAIALLISSFERSADLSARRGVLNKIVGGVVVGHLPRRLEFLRRLHQMAVLDRRTTTVPVEIVSRSPSSDEASAWFRPLMKEYWPSAMGAFSTRLMRARKAIQGAENDEERARLSLEVLSFIAVVLPDIDARAKTGSQEWLRSEMTALIETFPSSVRLRPNVAALSRKYGHAKVRVREFLTRPLRPLVQRFRARTCEDAF